MRHPLRTRAWLLLVAVLCVAPAASAARLFAGVDYGGSGDLADPRRMDIHTPEVPGPHPLLVLAGITPDEGLAAGMVAREHIVVEVRVRDGQAHEDLLRAIQFLRRRASSYGGDPLRQILIAGPALADAALRVAAAPQRLAADGVPPSALRGVVVDGGSGGDDAPLPVGNRRFPPVLLVAGSTRAGRLASVTLAERWRASGAAVEVVQRGAGPRSTLQDLVLAWLPGTMLPRLARFETLRFEPEPTPSANVVAWATARGALWQVTGDAPLRVLRQEAPGAHWTTRLDVGACRPLWFGALDPVAELWLAVDCGGRLQAYALRDDGTFAGPVAHGEAPGGVEHAWALALDPTREVLLVLDAGSTSHILRLGAAGPAQAEALPSGLRLTGAVTVGMVAHVAAFGPGGGRLLRRIDGPTPVWTTAAAWPATRGALRAPTALDAEGDAVLGLLDGGEVVRIEPARGEIRTEADLRAAFASRWDELAAAPRAAGESFVALRQPQGGDRVHAIGLALERPGDRARGWYLLRQGEGRFAYGRVGGRDGDAGSDVRGLFASPFVADAGAVVFAASADASTPLWRGILPGDAVPQGLWIDVRSPDRGIALFRTDPEWMLLHWWTDADGAPLWASGTGTFEDRLWVPQGDLQRYRRVPGDERLQAEGAGLPELRLGVGPDDPACAAAPQADDVALAVLRLDGDAPRCLALLAAGDDVRPAIDGSGIWSARDGRFGLAVSSAGSGAEGAERVLLFDFGDDGSPRWAFGRGTRREGTTALTPQVPGAGGARRALAYRFSGACGRIEGSVRLQFDAADAASPEIVLQRIAGGACY
jgi:hypothetical protein